MIATIERLRTISDRCLSGQPLDEEDALWLGSSLAQFLTQQCDSIAEALGLQFPKGGVPWWREAAIRERNAVLRQLAIRHFSDLCPAARAREIYTMTLRYASSSWRFDRLRDAMPEHYAGRPSELVWRAFKSGATMPVGERHLRTILGE